MNYKNSDATWHTLLTIQCYDKTPANIHKFLPIVSLGDQEDKGISWGATIPDQYGNYYYTSFSPAGYVLPYLFVKIFRLPINETSLYIFNTILFLISLLFVVSLIYELFHDSPYRIWIAGLGAFIYTMNPELLHGMGVVYWHQSIMQVTLMIQIWAYYVCHSYIKCKNTTLKLAKVIFGIMCVINPYIEWSGYIANMGFMIACFIWNWKKDKRAMVTEPLKIAGMTLTAFILFCIHYLLVLDAEQFFTALQKRFMARNFHSSVSLNLLIQGYFQSFHYIWWVMVLLFFTALFLYKNNWKNNSIIWNHKCLFFVLIFPVIENIIMKQHAIEYSYDRMKLVFSLVMIICDLSHMILIKSSGKFIFIITGATVAAAIGNFECYKSNTEYIWDAPFRSSNLALAERLSDYEDNSIMGNKTTVRGYINLTFHRGIYEYISINRLKDICSDKGKPYGILLEQENAMGIGWNMVSYKGALVIDFSTGKQKYFSVSDTDVHTTEWGYMAAQLSDDHWKNGISNNGTTILFYNSEELLKMIQCSDKIWCKNEEYLIKDISYDDTWIRVSVEEEAFECMFPTIMCFGGKGDFK